MFTEDFTALEQGGTLDLELLQRRFDLAMTKKLGVIKLPPSFWMRDSKINPRADHLLQVALLLGDRERCDLAVSVLAVENEERKTGRTLHQVVEEILASLLRAAPVKTKKTVEVLGANLLNDLAPNP